MSKTFSKEGLCSKPRKGEPKICKIPVGGKSIRIHLPGLWVGPSPKNLHKNTESPSNTLEETKNQTSDLYRRKAHSSKVTKQNRSSKRHNSLPPTKPGIPHKLGKIGTNPKQDNGIPRNKNRLRGNDFLNPKPKDQRASLSSPKDHSNHIHITKEPSQHHWQTQGNSPSILTSPHPSKISSKSSEGKSEVKIIRITDSPVHRSPTRTKVVEGKAINSQCLWKITEIQRLEMAIASDAAGGPQGGWGAATQGMTTGGAWTPQDKKLHINILEMMAAEMAIKTFTRGRTVKSIHLQVDNMTALHYILKMGE